MSPQVKCIYHPQHHITNFCSDMKCLLPLCPECVRIHLQEHRKQGSYGDFDTIEEILDGTSHQIKQFVQYFQQKKDRINYLLKMQRDLQIDYFQKLNDAKLKMLQLINDFFERLEHDFFTEQVKEQEKKVNLSAQNTIQRVFNQERYNEKYLDGLQDDEREKIYEINTKELQNVDLSIANIESSIKDLNINDDEISNIKQSLNNLINFQSHQFNPDTPIYTSPVITADNTQNNSTFTQNSPPKKPETLKNAKTTKQAYLHQIPSSSLQKSQQLVKTLQIPPQQAYYFPSKQSFSPRNMTFVPLTENRASSPQPMRSNTYFVPSVITSINQSPAKIQVLKENQRNFTNNINIKNTWQFQKNK